MVVRRHNFGEADRLLTLATPGGKRRVIARGVRKTSSKLAGHIELFTHTTMLLAVGRNLDIITQSVVRNSFAAMRTDLPRLSAAYYAAELYDKVMHEAAEDTDHQFAELVGAFTALNTTRNIDLVLRAYELRLLSRSGYRPHLHHCAICHARLTEEAAVFSATAGGVLCPDHHHTDPHALPMGLATFKLLRYLQSHPLPQIERLVISEQVRTEAERLLRAYLRALLERDLKTVAFLESLRVPVGEG